MRILLVCDSADGRNGWSRYGATLRSMLQSLGHEVAICAAGSGADFPLPGPALSLCVNPWPVWQSARALDRAVQAHRADAMHIVSEPYSLAIPFMRQSVPTVLTLHGSYAVRLWQGWWQRLLCRSAWRRIARFVAVSDYTKHRAIETARAADEPTAQYLESHLSVIPNTVPMPPFPDRTPKEGKRVLFVGEVKRRKGVLEAVRAIAAYQRNSGREISFDIVGRYKEDAYVSDVRKAMQAGNIDDHCTLHGSISDQALDHLLTNADLYLMPSQTADDTFEGFGLAYIEAAARGIACIGPNTSGAAEAISPGVSGFTVDPSDIEAMAARIADVLDRQLIDPVTCRAWAERFAPNQQAPAWRQLYADLTSR